MEQKTNNFAEKYFDMLIDIMERSIRSQEGLTRKEDLKILEERLADIINDSKLSDKDEETRFNTIINKIEALDQRIDKQSDEIKKLKDREDFIKKMYWLGQVLQGAIMLGIAYLAIIKG